MSFFRNFNNFSTKRENAIKEALINTLSENAREIQYEVKQRRCECLELCEVTSSLCTTLEAIFLHGLKDSLLWETINVIAGDEERRPEPSFWSPMLVFMHKQVIEQIQSLSQITSEIGQCRAWIRTSLNESLFSAYLNNMSKTSSALNHYYKKFALLKDGECLEMAAKVMEGIEACVQFNLPINSSLLNQWPDYSLQLSGLWTPPLKSCPISSGVDVAGSLPTDTATMSIPTPQPLRTNKLFEEYISNSPFKASANAASQDLTQREQRDLFLKKVDEVDEADSNTELEAEEITETPIEQEKVKNSKRKPKKLNLKKSKDAKENEDSQSDGALAALSSTDVSSITSDMTPTKSPHGNSLMNLMQTSWSGEEMAPTPSTPTSERQAPHRSSSINSALSYDTIVRRHLGSRPIAYNDIWGKFCMQNAIVPPSEQNDDDRPEQEIGENSSGGSRTNSDFEILPNSTVEKFDIVELQEMVEKLCKLARQPGLDAQGFLCKSCQHPLGIGYSNFQVCSFTGNYFCDSCMDLEPTMIPAKIIYNWDFRKYPVSKRAATFLAEIRSQPLIDMELLNPEIYNASDAMAELQSLRIRLNFIRAYLYTCRPESKELLQRQFYGREYLYESIHQYSTNDLAMILRGTLYQQLQKAFKIGEGHVLKCPLCSVKGFICEICKSARVLYPFHIETTYRCETCGAVFHAQCLNEHQPCPRCERKRSREAEQLQIEAISEPDPEALENNAVN